eukprot:2869633-Prymnesium_polylepis.1
MRGALDGRGFALTALRRRELFPAESVASSASTSGSAWPEPAATVAPQIPRTVVLPLPPPTVSPPPPPPPPPHLPPRAPTLPSTATHPQPQSNRRGLGLNCPNKFTAVAGACLTLLTQPQAVPTAERACAALTPGAALARIDTAAQQAAATKLCERSPTAGVGQGCWIGATDRTCSVERGVNYEGNILRGGIDRGASLQTCCDACQQTAGCNFFDVQPAMGRCVLMATRGARRESAAHVAGRVGGGEWGWQDGHPLAFTGWVSPPNRHYRGAPIDGAACATLTRPAAQANVWGWIEAPCNAMRSALCTAPSGWQKPLPPPPPPPPPPRP